MFPQNSGLRVGHVLTQNDCLGQKHSALKPPPFSVRLIRQAKTSPSIRLSRLYIVNNMAHAINTVTDANIENVDSTIYKDVVNATTYPMTAQIKMTVWAQGTRRCAPASQGEDVGAFAKTRHRSPKTVKYRHARAHQGPSPPPRRHRFRAKPQSLPNP